MLFPFLYQKIKNKLNEIDEFNVLWKEKISIGIKHFLKGKTLSATIIEREDKVFLVCVDNSFGKTYNEKQCPFIVRIAEQDMDALEDLLEPLKTLRTIEGIKISSVNGIFRENMRKIREDFYEGK